MTDSIIEIDSKIKAVTKMFQTFRRIDLCAISQEYKINVSDIVETNSDEFSRFVGDQNRLIQQIQTKNSQTLISLASSHPMWLKYLKNIPGIDIRMAGFIIGLIDINKSKDLENLLIYTGTIDGGNNTRCNLYLKRKLKTLARELCLKDSPFALYYWNTILQGINKHLLKGEEVYEGSEEPAISNKTMIEIFTEAKQILIEYFLANYWCAAQKLYNDVYEKIDNYIKVDVTNVGQNKLTSWEFFYDTSEEDTTSHIVSTKAQIRALKEKVDTIFKSHGKRLPKSYDESEINTDDEIIVA